MRSSAPAARDPVVVFEASFEDVLADELEQPALDEYRSETVRQGSRKSKRVEST
jgi:hypothetical protein